MKHCRLLLQYITLPFATAIYHIAVCYCNISHCRLLLQYITLPFATAIYHIAVCYCNISHCRLLLQYITLPFATAIYHIRTYEYCMMNFSEVADKRDSNGTKL